MGICSSSRSPPPGDTPIKPLFVYFPAAGRGELSRLISAAGDLAIDDYPIAVGYKSYAGFFGQMPFVKHGSFSLCQSSACEKYLAAMSPRFKDLTSKQVAIDNMFAATLEDMRVGCYKVTFGDANAKANASETIPPHLDKYLTFLESRVPDNGFVHGLDFPTTADVVLVNFAEAAGPFNDAIEFAGGYDWQSKYPKIKGLVDRAKLAVGVKEYVETSGTLKQKINMSFMGGIILKTLGHAVTFQSLRPASLSASLQPPPIGPIRPAAVLSGTPEMLYFPIAGRGELARLISALGGVDLKVTFPGASWKEQLGFLGSLPILKHGDLSICQSGAIESYLAAISPKFMSLTAQQRAYDDMFAATKEDILQACAKVVFANEESKATLSAALPGVLEKFLTVIEDLVPESGFVQGLGFPTVADLVLLNFAEAVMPFQKAIEFAGGYAWHDKFPKIKSNIDRTKEVPEVKNYLASQSCSMKGSL